MNKLRKIAKENKSIYLHKSYTNSKNEQVDLKNDIELCMINTKYYNDVYITNKIHNITKFTVKDNIINCGTIDCIIKLREEGETGNIIALNFASATTPGGGYLLGSTAQEESICRASLLYPCLTKDMRMYKENRKNYSPLYTDRMKYSHNVPVIRNDNGELLDNYVLASFITSAAPNRRVAKSVFISDEKINNSMKLRIKKIISLALYNDPSVLVLGAFGCGVFGNDREVVYNIFEEVINELVPLNKVKVIFTVRENVSRK